MMLQVLIEKLNRENLAYLAVCLSLIAGSLLWCSLNDVEAIGSHFEVLDETEEKMTLIHIWDTYSTRIIPERYAPKLATLNIIALWLAFVLILDNRKRQGDVVAG